MTAVDEVLGSLTPAQRDLLARRLRTQRGDGVADRIPALPRDVAEPTFPLSFAQQRLWFLDQWQPGSTAYVVPASFTFTGAVDADAVTRSLGDLVERHETLRTTFETVGEEPVQRIRAPFVPVVEHHDLRGMSSQEQQARLRGARAQQVARPGTILVFLEPLYAGGLEGVIPGSSCIVNAYSSNHELLASSPDMSTTRRLVLHGVDAVGLVHALLLRIQALVLPIQTLVFSGH